MFGNPKHKFVIPLSVSQESPKSNPFPLAECILVGGFNPSEKYKSVGMTIPNIWESMKHVPNHQPVYDMTTSSSIRRPLPPCRRRRLVHRQRLEAIDQQGAVQAQLISDLPLFFLFSWDTPWCLNGLTMA